eukprot:CAMPEP_0180269388 /NCGR_PEP_ID=MMETSP0988-20121125/2625_1 /TAXON_ID=697907 /ORGANISM="non described non described, Strain CCMP2293" /LENGTH=37 /DNA_ID= /DNA_START= /DNA_END= /DNA_ORIENTATION=
MPNDPESTSIAKLAARRGAATVGAKQPSEQREQHSSF